MYNNLNILKLIFNLHLYIRTKINTETNQAVINKYFSTIKRKYMLLYKEIKNIHFRNNSHNLFAPHHYSIEYHTLH